MSDSTLYLYTSLTAGSSHIVTATARLETILKANKLPFKAIDVATDDAARKLWGRKSKGKKLPGLVKFGTVVGDLEEIEEWNEYGELRMQVNSVVDLDSFSASTSTSTPAADSTTATPPATLGQPATTQPPKQSTIKIQNPPAKETSKDDSITVSMRQASEEAAAKAKGSSGTDSKPDTKTSTEATQQQQSSTAGEGEKKETAEDTAGQQQNVRRKSVNPAPEIEDNAVPQRPMLQKVAEEAAVSSENFRADNAEALGLVEHHRGSIVSATNDEERDRVARDLRESVSAARADVVEGLKGVAGGRRVSVAVEDDDIDTGGR